MFIVGEEDFKVNLDSYQVFNQQAFLNISLISLNTMIVNNRKPSKKYPFCQLHVVPIILLQLIVRIKFTAGAKQDMVKQDAAKKQKSQFLSM
jgi:hypothetical protein